MLPAFKFLLHITGPQAAQTIPLPIGTSVIGRQPGSDVWLDDLKVSRSHATITCNEGECILTDTGSANGTFVNGEKLPPQAATLLSPGDKVIIGPFELAISRVSAAVQAALPADRPARPPAPPPPPTPPSPHPAPTPPARDTVSVEELIQDSRRLLSFLPGIYDTPFMAQFLRVFESILLPIEWEIDGFDLLLDPATAPAAFLPWLSNWYQLTWDQGWNEAQRRAFLKDAHRIYARRGTGWALSRILEIYLGLKPEIIDLADDLAPHTFRVRLPLSPRQADRRRIEALIDAHKPAYTTYQLEFVAP